MISIRNRLIAILTIMMLMMMTASVFAEGEAASEVSTVTENGEASREVIDYSLYPIVTEDQAVQLIAKSIKNREKTLRFRIDGFSDTENGYDYVRQLLYKAYGDISEYYKNEKYADIFLDYSALEAGCFEGYISYGFSKKQCANFERKLKIVENSLKLKGLSDKKKAFKIYRWITHNVKYDTKAFYFYREHWYSMRDDIEFTAYGALMKKKAVCQGIACLYYRMLKDAGVDACMISANGPGSSDCHTWVLVKIGKRWYNADPTFDGTRHKNDTKYEYFLKTDKTYKKIKHYLPKTPKAFKKAHPMGKKDLKY